MTKDVIIGITGLQFGGEECADSLEMIASGEYYNKNGKHYLKYEEVVEGFSESNKNLVKIEPGRVEVTKRGLTNLNMIFEENKKHVTCYQTPFGNLMLGISDSEVSIEESEHKLVVKASYSLEINYEHVSDCVIQINAYSKENGEFSFKNA